MWETAVITLRCWGEMEAAESRQNFTHNHTNITDSDLSFPLLSTLHHISLYWFYSIILHTIVKHTTYMHCRCINSQSCLFTLLTSNETGFIIFTGSLPFQCAFAKQMFFGLKDKAYASAHNFTSAKQARCSQAEEPVQERVTGKK